MKHCFRLFTLLIFIAIAQAHAAKIELEFKGEKQVVEFDPNNKPDFERAENMWRKSDGRTFYVYSETGVFRVFEEPREDAKFKEIGGWYQQLNTRHPRHPDFAGKSWDKTKWHPRFYFPERGWLKLDDPNLIWPNQLKPVKEWPIRYIAYYGGIEMNAPEDGKKRKYDEYERWHFDREGFMLDNRTMKRKKLDENFVRVFQHRNFVKVTAVAPTNLDTAVSRDGGMGYAFNLKQALAEPKIEYDKQSESIFVWAAFDDPATVSGS